MVRVELEPGELPLVSFFLSPESWYLFTTRRIVGRYNGHNVEVSPLDVVKDYFPKRRDLERRDLDEHEIKAMTLRLSDRTEVKLEFEAGCPSMGPIYYLRYWKFKYPILHKLKDNPGA